MASSINPETPSADLKMVSGIRALTKIMVAEVVLRFILFAATLSSVMAIVTSKQTELIPVPFPPYGAPMSAKYSDIPVFIYSLAVLSVACLYSIITTLISFAALMKRSSGSSRKFTSCVVMVDVLLLGIIASATGASGEAAYLGFKGNSNVGWHKICNVYDSYCRHMGISVLSSLFASIVLSSLVVLYIVTLSQIRKNNVVFADI